jgi:rSAM/selenodomain-associated transferase 1
MDDRAMTSRQADSGQAALLVMAKRPSPGHTKSRLTPPFSAADAAALYECFLRDVLDLARAVPDVTPFIAYSPPDSENYFRELAPDLGRVPQIGNTLGDRLDYVLSFCLEAGFKTVAAINSDSPTLPVSHLEQAFQCLAEKDTDVVLGPCEDGGYYLIGWKEPQPALVREVEMSTRHVLQDTLDLAALHNLQVSLTPTWYDIDNIDDLERLAGELAVPSNYGRHTRTFLMEHLKEMPT